MKYPVLITAFLCCTITTFSQSRRTRVTVYSNGLTYNDATASRLKQIIDSMHSRYTKSNQQKTYYSRPQTKGHYIALDSTFAKQALLDIQKNISLKDFVKKYPKAFLKKDLLIVYLADNQELRYTRLPIDHESYAHIIFEADKPALLQTIHNYLHGRTGNWVYEYRMPGTYNDRYYSAEIYAFYLDAPLKTIALPERYAAMLRYADFMIDKKTRTFLPTATDWLDFTDTEAYYSKTAALTRKRNRYAYDRCGHDHFHWPHMFEIAQLAAETANWPVFMRAYLDLMNSKALYDYDYFGDTGYPLVKNLELLGIHTYDLLLAVSLNIGNPAPRYYAANLQFICLPFERSKDSARLEQAMLSMMADKELADYNRLRMHYLFSNCLHYHHDVDPGVELLKAADKKLPEYLNSKLVIEDLDPKDPD